MSTTSSNIQNSLKTNNSQVVQQSPQALFEQLLLDNLKAITEGRYSSDQELDCLLLWLPRLFLDNGDQLGRVGIKVFPELSEAIADACLYEEITNTHYFLALSGSHLSVVYQQITGSRALMELSENFIPSLVSKMSSQAMAKENSNPSEKKPGSIKDQLAQLTVSGQNIYIPTSHLSKYAEIKRLMINAGGKYNAKGYFSFDIGQSASLVMNRLLDGDKIQIKQETQFFATNPERAESACDALGDVAGKRILEPSAGDGALADVARQRGAEVVVIENWAPNVHKLEAKNYSVIPRDFLTVSPEETGLFDAIIANPPFTKGQDIQHIRHMLDFLKPEGTLSVIASISAIEGTQRKQVEFQRLLAELNAKIELIPAGDFKSSGTMVATCHIVLVKPTLDAHIEHEGEESMLSM